MSEPVKPAGEAMWTEAILRLVIELVSVLGAAAFVAGAAANSWIFSRWNLNFLQLATPGDVIQSGLQIIWWLTPLAILFMIFYSIAYKIGSFRYNISIGISMIVIIAVSFVAAILQIISFEVNVIICSYAVIPYVALIAVNRRNERAFTGGYNFTVFLMAAAIFFTAAFILLRGGTEHGYHGGRLGLTVESCPEPAMLLWSGDRALVVRCGDQSPFVILREGPVLQTLPRA